MKIYTRFGDEGKTRLLGGVVTDKSDLRVIVCGELDELSAALGLSSSLLAPSPLVREIESIQKLLFDAGAAVAATGTSSRKIAHCDWNAAASRLEQSIDAMNAELPSLDCFILPGGSNGGAALHLARAICRRCERAWTLLVQSWPEETRIGEVQKWLNRLSDWLFVAARLENQRAGASETKWLPARSSDSSGPG